jgi:hypothetical protein
MRSATNSFGFELFAQVTNQVIELQSSPDQFSRLIAQKPFQHEKKCFKAGKNKTFLYHLMQK